MKKLNILVALFLPMFLASCLAELPAFKKGDCLVEQDQDPWGFFYQVEAVGVRSYLVHTVLNCVGKYCRAETLIVPFGHQSKYRKFECPKYLER